VRHRTVVRRHAVYPGVYTGVYTGYVHGVLRLLHRFYRSKRPEPTFYATPLFYRTVFYTVLHRYLHGFDTASTPFPLFYVS